MLHRLSPTNMKKSTELVSQFIQIPENVDTINFDACFIDECFVLKNIAGYIFKRVLEQIKLSIDESSLATFINSLCDHYNENHFHNFQHAINVLHMTYILLDKTKIIDKLNKMIVFATLISAISHDVDHPGNTNSYEINSMSKYARLYNDISVLENHHCSLTFDLLEQSELMKSIPISQFKEFRKTIITCILGTDMSKHTEYLNKMKSFNFVVENPTSDEQLFLASCFVHFADLSNPIKSFIYSFEWSRRISTEFYEQTLKEDKEGLPSLSFMKVNDKVSMCINEINFITNISIPTWTEFTEKFTHIEDIKIIMENIHTTLSKWEDYKKKLLDENDINIFNY